MKTLPLLLLFAALPSFAQKNLSNDMQQATENLLNSLTSEQKAIANLPFDSEWRFDWNYTPRERKGLPLKSMTADQHKLAMKLLQTGLSKEGMDKTEAIISLEYVLRQVEKRPENDTRRDPENYAFAVFGNPDAKQPWAWSMEGHHLSFHYTIVAGKVEFMPSFFGTNPGIVLPGFIQEGKQVLKEESEVAFRLLHLFDQNQLKQVVLSEKAPADLVTTNTRQAKLDKHEGLAYRNMTLEQQKLLKELLQVYLIRYPVTLKKQALNRIEAADLNELYFAWMGDNEPLRGAGRGHYYRIHGPTLLIEFDNTQNDANHVHTIVRDLTNDWGGDMLKAHYEASHAKK